MPEEAPYAFLSSLYTEHKALRAAIFDLGLQEARPVWVAEKSDPALVDREPLEIVDALIDRVRKAKVFICVFGGHRSERDHGAPVKVASTPSAVSYFEIEVYQAALLERPIHLFIASGFVPGPRLSALIETLKFALPESWRATRAMTDEEIIGEVRAILRDGGLSSSRRRTPLRRLVQRLDDIRSTLWHRRRGHYADLVFLNGEYERRAHLPDKDLIENLLKDASRGEVDFERKLARLWIAFRELQAAPFDEPRFAEYRDFWNAILGRWTSAAAWYGLHGHLYMGCLAALNTQAVVREQLRESARPASSTTSTQHPGGPLASAYYSIAKLNLDLVAKRRNFEKALAHVEKSLATREDGDRSGLLAIRGSIHLQLWKVVRAVKDYEEVLRLREAAGEGAGRIGEALSELGYGYIWEGRFFKGREYLEKGVQLLAQSDRKEFLVRAMEKLSVAYRLTGQRARARETKREAERIAAERRMLQRMGREDKSR